MLSFLTSCTKQYITKEDKLYFKTWNEAHGRQLHLVEKVDINSFKELKKGYGKDHNHIFYNGQLIKNSDPKSFEFLKNGYAVDKHLGYYYGKPFASNKTLKTIEKPYAVDDKKVFFKGQLLADCNPKTFKILYQNNLHNWATDGHFYYYGKFKIPSKNYQDVVYFKNSKLSKDKEYVYILDRLFNYNDIKGSFSYKVFEVDVATFGINENGDYFDKDGVFTPYERKKAYEIIISEKSKQLRQSKK